MCIRDSYLESSKIEATGYGRWPRVREITEFCKAMGYQKLGVAFCGGLKEEGRIACETVSYTHLDVYKRQGLR